VPGHWSLEQFANAVRPNEHANGES